MSLEGQESLGKVMSTGQIHTQGKAAVTTQSEADPVSYWQYGTGM